VTEQELWLYDVQGYLHVPGALTAEQVGAMNEAIDRNRDQLQMRTEAQSLDGRGEGHGGTPAAKLQGTHGRSDFGGYLFWDEPWCQPFRDIIASRRILRILLKVLGPRFRLTSTAGLAMTKGAEGFIMHGGGTPELEFMREQFFHRFEGGRIYGGLMSVSYTLTDVEPGDGGFVCVPGSHKANYECPLPVRRHEVDLDCVRHLPMKAGDAVIFTEALTHGTIPWQGEAERRLLRYLYCPAIHGMAHNPQYPALQEELTDPLQKLMLAPSYHPGQQEIEALLDAKES
jgi:hypothetical protein